MKELPTGDIQKVDICIYNKLKEVKESWGLCMISCKTSFDMPFWQYFSNVFFRQCLVFLYLTELELFLS